MANVTIPIVTGQFNLAQPWKPLAFIVTETAGAPASVTVTGPGARVLFAAQLAAFGQASWGQGATPDLMPAGQYTIAVVGTVAGSLIR